jgi:hypothetical protein
LPVSLFRHPPIPFHKKPPFLISSIADSDASRYTDGRPADPRSTNNVDFGPQQACAILSAFDIKCLTKLGRTVRQIYVVHFLASQPAHCLNPTNGFDPPNQDRLCNPLSLRHNICAKVHPVSKVNVQMPPLPKHDVVSLCSSPVSMTCRVE